MNMKYLTAIVVLLSAMVVTSCRGTEKTEAITAEIEAAQMQGREAARWYLHQNIPDSVSAIEVARQARAKKYELEKKGKNEAAAAFDSTFVKTVRAVDPKRILPED